MLVRSSRLIPTTPEDSVRAGSLVVIATRAGSERSQMGRAETRSGVESHGMPSGCGRALRQIRGQISPLRPSASGRNDHEGIAACGRNDTPSAGTNHDLSRISTCYWLQSDKSRGFEGRAPKCGLCTGGQRFFRSQKAGSRRPDGCFRVWRGRDVVLLRRPVWLRPSVSQAGSDRIAVAFSFRPRLSGWASSRPGQTGSTRQPWQGPRRFWRGPCRRPGPVGVGRRRRRRQSGQSP
jgi:hypothetical protein